MYAASADPWEFESRWYEARKYAITLALLPTWHYGDAFEPGCSIGVLTEMLAPRCHSRALRGFSHLLSTLAATQPGIG